MKTDELNNAINDISFELIENADKRKNNNKRLVISLSAAAACIVLLAIPILSSHFIPVKLNTPFSILFFNNKSQTDITADACYSDGVSSFKELESKSSCIIRATVTKIYNASPMQQTSVLTVSKVYKGKVDDNINLWQLINDNPLLTDKEYILFINKNNDSKDENGTTSYYPVAGSAGVMIINQSGTPSPAYAYLADKDFEDWCKDNYK